jgi:hypothetical protein
VLCPARARHAPTAGRPPPPPPPISHCPLLCRRGHARHGPPDLPGPQSARTCHLSWLLAFARRCCLLLLTLLCWSLRLLIAGRGRRVPGAGGAEGRQRLLGAGGGREPAAADGEREPADAGVRRQGAEPGRDGGAVGGAHGGRGALQLLRAPPLLVRAQRRGAGPVHGPRLPGGAGAAVPPAGDRRRRPAPPHGPRHAHRLRHQLLRQPGRQARPARLRPGAARRPGHRRAGARLHQQPRHLPDRLRRRHDQDGCHTGAHRHRRHRPDQLQGG